MIHTRLELREMEVSEFRFLAPKLSQVVMRHLAQTCLVWWGKDSIKGIASTSEWTESCSTRACPWREFRLFECRKKVTLRAGAIRPVET